MHVMICERRSIVSWQRKLDISERLIAQPNNIKVVPTLEPDKLHSDGSADTAIDDCTFALSWPIHLHT